MHVPITRATFRLPHILATHNRTNYVCTRSPRHYSELKIVKDANELNLSNLLRRKYMYEDYLTSGPILLLTKALEDYLPQGRKRKVFLPKWIQLGQQHTFFRPHLSTHDLCQDGTDRKFLPGSPDVWKYRLWAGGSVSSHSKATPSFMKPRLFGLVECVSDYRVVETAHHVDKVFVTIERNFIGPIRNDFKNLKTDSVPDDISQQTLYPVFMTELERICFLREPPQSLKADRQLKAPTNPLFSHSTIPRRGLLFQFSALTFNAHSIHIDRQFAEEEYGAKDLIVHGPLTQVLMIEFLRRFLFLHQTDVDVAVIPRSIDYTNLRPLYVDEPLTLCCKPLNENEGTWSNVEDVKTWQVWIQTGEAENISLAVKATISVDKITRREFDKIIAESKERAENRAYMQPSLSLYSWETERGSGNGGVNK